MLVVLLHTDDILHVLHTISVAFDIIAITETWVTDPFKDLFNIPYYSLYCFSCLCRRGGGLFIFVRNIFTAECITHDIEMTSFEQCLLCIKCADSNVSCLISVIYTSTPLKIHFKFS